MGLTVELEEGRKKKAENNEGLCRLTVFLFSLFIGENRGGMWKGMVARHWFLPLSFHPLTPLLLFSLFFFGSIHSMIGKEQDGIIRGSSAAGEEECEMGKKKQKATPPRPRSRL